MIPSEPALAVPDAISSKPGRRRTAPGLLAGLIVVAAMVAVGVVSRFWLPGGVDSIWLIDIPSKLLPPFSPGHPLGTDHFGRDILIQLMRATSNTLVIVTLGTSVAVAVGVTLGLVATMFSGPVEHTLMRLVDIVYAIPAVLFALVLAAKLGASISTTVIALGLWFFPLIARVTRSAALAVRQRAFVQAARTYGRGELYIAWRHILPNIASIVLVQVTLVAALCILVEAALAFLGMGTQPPEPSWGRMLRESQDYFAQAPWLAVIPGVTIVLVVLSLNLVGNGMRDRLDRRSHGGDD